jgi:CPA1 family monovalent cation:H+ antiporter
MELDTTTIDSKIHIESIMLIFSFLFLVAATSAVLLKRLKFPYTIGLVVIGIIISIVSKSKFSFIPLDNVALSYELIMYILLPILVFEASLNIKIHELFKDIIPVLLLAIVGVAISTLIVGYITHKFGIFSYAGAMLFGALISATDPVAVIALFKESNAPKRIALLMDSESLFNDATAIVSFNIVLSIILTSAKFDFNTLSDAVTEFFRVFFGGIAIGCLLGGCAIILLRISRGMPYVQIAYTTVLAFSSFIIADIFFKTSGIMAVITSGLLVSNYSKRSMVDFITFRNLDPYWEFMAFTANSFIFLLLGIQEDYLFSNYDNTLSLYPIFSIAIFAVLLARFITIYSILPISNKVPQNEIIDKDTKKIMFWGGLRGVVPVALMLSIPPDVPERKLIMETTLAVILFSLLIQGTTIGWLMNKLGITKNN